MKLMNILSVVIACAFASYGQAQTSFQATHLGSASGFQGITRFPDFPQITSGIVGRRTQDFGYIIPDKEPLPISQQERY